MSFFDEEKEAYVLDPSSNTVKEVRAFTTDSLTGDERRVKLGKSGLIELASKYMEDNKGFMDTALALANILGAVSPHNFVFALSLGRVLGLNSAYLKLTTYDISEEEANEIKARHEEQKADLAKRSADLYEKDAQEYRKKGGDPLEGDA